MIALPAGACIFHLSINYPSHETDIIGYRFKNMENL